MCYAYRMVCAAAWAMGRPHRWWMGQLHHPPCTSHIAPCFPLPPRRRTAQMAETGGNELEAVKNYFNTAGYDRWKKIYGETEDVNKASA